MARPTARVLTLLELLQSGGIRTVAELADRLGVDERTVRRYVDHLIDLDVPVESVRGRYGGYRLAPGYRMPPLMLSDDEALAVLLGLVAGRRAGLTTATGTASETAAAKIRRVLPERLARRLDAVLDSLAFTAPPGEAAAPDSRGPALDRRRGAPSPADLDQVHRRRRPAQRTHAAPVRARRPLGPLVRDGRGSRDRRGPDVPARPHRGRQDPARLVRAARRTRSGAARPVRARHGPVPARGDPADPGDGRADPRPASRPASRSWRSRRPPAAQTGRPSAGSASSCGWSGSTGCPRCSPRSTGRSSSSDQTNSATSSPRSPAGSRPPPGGTPSFSCLRGLAAEQRR